VNGQHSSVYYDQPSSKTTTKEWKRIYWSTDLLLLHNIWSTNTMLGLIVTKEGTLPLFLPASTSPGRNFKRSPRSWSTSATSAWMSADTGSTATKLIVIYFGLIGLNSLVCLISLIGLICFISLIGISGFGLFGLVGVRGFGLVGLVGLVDLSIISLVGLLASSARQLIGLIGFISLIGLISFDNLGTINLIGSLVVLARLILVASLVYQHRLCIRFAAAVKVAAAKTTQWLKHAATRGVATAFSSRVAAKLAATATLFVAACKQAAHGVAVMQNWRYQN
jgi:hypothetical protein